MASLLPPPSASPRGTSLWWWAFGYFACYAPYSALTRLLSSDRLVPARAPLRGLELLPSTAISSVVTMLAFLFATGWWRHARRWRVLGLRLPMPRRATAISGLCSTGIIATTTLAYSFSGVSLVLVALLMRGGVLVLAPVVDRLTGRRVRWPSWVALGLSLTASLVAVSSSWDDARMPLVVAIDLAIYLACYFARLTLMSHQAKSDRETNLRYFVEELMISSTALLAAVAVAAVALGGAAGRDLAAGFTSFFDRPVAPLGLAVGVLSQGTGIFGGLVFLDQRETSFCVPVNRASSVLAVLVASLGLTATFGFAPPHLQEWLAAGLLLLALAVLALPRTSPAPAASPVTAP